MNEFVEIKDGRLVLAGTRFPLAQVLSQLADGDSVDEMSEAFELDREQVSQFLLSLAEAIEDPSQA